MSFSYLYSYPCSQRTICIRPNSLKPLFSAYLVRILLLLILSYALCIMYTVWYREEFLMYLYTVVGIECSCHWQTDGYSSVSFLSLHNGDFMFVSCPCVHASGLWPSKL